MNAAILSRKTNHNSAANRYLVRKTLAPIAILLIICTLNFQHLFVDVLWHDDGFWYYLATEGEALNHALGREKVISLGPYLDYFYAQGMLEWGVPITRSIFVFVMFLCSLSLYFIYQKMFGFTKSIALLAATIPNTLPSLIGIPIGLNASYAMWGLLPLLISIIFIFLSLTRNGPASYFYWLAGFLVYTIGLNLSISSTFLIPGVLFIFAMFVLSRQNKLKPLLFSIPFLALGLWQVYKQLLFTHKTPTQIPLQEIFSRSLQFVEMGSFLPFNSLISMYAACVLMLLGFVGLASSHSKIHSKPDHFHCSNTTYMGLLVLWPIIWIVSNSVAYVAASPTFRVNDYAYISNYGIVLLQICGGGYLWYLISTKFEWAENLSPRIWLPCFVLFFMFIGIQKSTQLNITLDDWGETETSALLRQTFEKIEIPDNAQILILDTPTPQQGVFQVNSGYMRYLLNQNNVIALVGFELFPNDVFAKSTKWLNRMRNFERTRPTIAFRRVGDKLKRQGLLLQVQSINKGELPRLRWSLFDIGSLDSSPVRIAGDRGMASYYTYIGNQLTPPYTPGDIAFAPPDIPAVFVSQEIAEKISNELNLISSPVKFDNIVTLLSLKILKPKSEHRLQVLLRIEKKPKIFNLGYRVNNAGSGQTIPLWEMALEGDNILVEMPILPNQDYNKMFFLELLDMSKWPPKALNVTGKEAAYKVEIYLDSEI